MNLKRTKVFSFVLAATVASAAVAFAVVGVNKEASYIRVYDLTELAKPESDDSQYLEDFEDFQEQKIYESGIFIDIKSEENIVDSYAYPTLKPFNKTTYQVNKSYHIPKQFYYDILPEDMYCLIEGICDLEETQEISSMFLFAVAATEVGWHGDLVGKNNWFNWTPDARNYQNFDTVEDCIAFTGKRFETAFFNPEWYRTEVDNYFTIDEINSRYAFYNDGTVNTYWGEVVGEIIESFHNKYEKWVNNNDSSNH